LLPLLVMLGFAISKRIKAYGITELRYFVLLLGLWLLLAAVYFLASRKKNILLIPLSLCLFAFFSSFGPWGVFGVSKYSQLHRLQGLLEKNGLFKEGKVVNRPAKLSFADRKEISSTTEYIVVTHGYESLQPWFRENLDSMMRRDSLMGKYEERERAEAVLRIMHVSYASRYEDSVTGSGFSVYTHGDSTALSTEGLPYLIPDLDIAIGNDAGDQRYHVGKHSVAISLDSSLNQLHVIFSGGAQASAKDSAVVALQPLFQDSTRTFEYGTSMPLSKMILSFHCPWGNGKLVVTSASGIRRDRDMHVTDLRAHLLLGPL